MPQEKIKITRSEIEELYDIEENIEKPVLQDTEANATVEEYTQQYDEREIKERKQNGS